MAFSRVIGDAAPGLDSDSDPAVRGVHARELMVLGVLIPCPSCGRVHIATDVAPRVDGFDSVRDGVETLTPAQHEVFIRMAGGLSNRQLADEFVVTEDTIKAHVREIRRKLGAAREEVVFAANLFNAWRCALARSTDGA